MNNEKKLTILIPTLQGDELLRAALEALEVQTCNDFHTIVIFDSNEQALPAWLSNFQNLEVLFSGGDKGFAGTVNAGIRQCETELIMVLNDDARPEPDCIYYILQGAAKYKTADAFATKICFFYSPTLIESAGDSFSMAGRGFHRGWRKNDAPPFDEDREVFGPCAAAAIYRQRVFQQVGLFDEDFHLIHEDVDLSFRMRHMGMKTMYLSKAKVLHKGSVTIGIKSHMAVFYDSRNSEMVLMKNLPLLWFIRILPWYLLHLYHTFFCSFRTGRLSSFARGKFAALSMTGKMWRKGSLLALKSKVPFSEIFNTFDKEWHKQGIKRVLTDPKSLAFALILPLALFLIWLLAAH
jgi:GT2 family glycosyltransferase